MNRSGSRILFFLLLVSLVVAGVLPARGALVAQSTATSDAELAAAIDGALTALAEADRLSGSVLVARGDDILLKKGYGYAVIEWEVPNTPDTVFRLGSVSKLFTAMAILTLAEAGKLDIDDPICDYLSRCPAEWADITIYHLLTHTGGLPMEQPANKRAPTLVFNPGSFHYSNFGYNLLAEIVTSASGRPVRRYLQENLLTPLGMTATDMEYSAQAVIRHRADGYVGRSIRAIPDDASRYQGSASMYSTVEDLFLWARALFGGHVISDETFAEMRARAVDVPDWQGRYGFGLLFRPEFGVESIGHGGSDHGFRAGFLYIPEADVSIIQLHNRENSDREAVTKTIIGILFPDQFTEE